MIEDARKIPRDAQLETDLCVIGSGAAGITVATEYLRTGRSVIVIPGGGRHQSSQGLDLYRGKVDPPGSHEPLEENRLRMWGGTTTVWGGRCIPFDPIDFQFRSWVPNSGWPIRLDDLRDEISRGNRFSEAGKADFDARTTFPDRQQEILTGFDNDDLVSWPLERWSVPTDYAKRYRLELDFASSVRVLLHSHAIHLQLDRESGKLSHVRCACSPGRDFRVRARTYVLACGALEVPRLLLAANDVVPDGLGNQNDLVGRFYQSHRFGVCGTVELLDPHRGFIYDFERDSEGVYCRRRFWLTPPAQERLATNNIMGFFFRNVSSSSEHRNAMVSTVMLVKTLLGGARKGPKRLAQIVSEQRRELLTHAGIVVRDFPSLVSQVGAVAFTRLVQKRRLPMILPPKRVNRFPLFYQSEHAPLRESRVHLDASETDEFGMPRLVASIRFSELDFHTITTFIQTFRNRIEESRLGRFHLSEGDREFLAHPERQEFNSNSHHVGTTRMSSDPSGGVVDTNCRVYGVNNLFVASSSVFPTSGHANPTLMIVALAMRLADHLKRTT